MLSSVLLNGSGKLAGWLYVRVISSFRPSGRTRARASLASSRGKTTPLLSLRVRWSQAGDLSQTPCTVRCAGGSLVSGTQGSRYCRFMPTPNAVDALLAEIERILNRHAAMMAYPDPHREGGWVVVCRCKMRFSAGEQHAIHQTRVIRGWFAVQAAHYAVGKTVPMIGGTHHGEDG